MHEYMPALKGCNLRNDVVQPVVQGVFCASSEATNHACGRQVHEWFWEIR